jgi:hypothetical protein
MLSSLMCGRPPNHSSLALYLVGQQALMPLYTAQLSGLWRVRAGARMGQSEMCPAARAPPQGACSGVSDVQR